MYVKTIAWGLLGLVFLSKETTSLATQPTETLTYLSTMATKPPDASTKLIRLKDDLSIKNAERYRSFQNAMARSQAIEFKRPGVRIKWKGKGMLAGQDIFLLGGMGPLADADLMVRLATELDATHSYRSVQLLSLPPPQSLQHMLEKGGPYGSALFDFLPRQKPVVLLSNSAYLAAPALKVWARQLKSLPKAMANRLSRLKNQTSLVLATQKARDNRLYESELAAVGIDALYPSAAMQTRIDKWIQLAKSRPIKRSDAQQFISDLDTIIRE